MLLFRRHQGPINPSEGHCLTNTHARTHHIHAHAHTHTHTDTFSVWLFERINIKTTLLLKSQIAVHAFIIGVCHCACAHSWMLTPFNPVFALQSPSWRASSRGSTADTASTSRCYRMAPWKAQRTKAAPSVSEQSDATQKKVRWFPPN